MTYNLIFGDDGHDYIIKKIDLKTGIAYDFTEEDAKELLEEESRREWALRNHRLVTETARKIQEGYGP